MANINAIMCIITMADHKLIIGVDKITIDDCINVSLYMYQVEIASEAIDRIGRAREFVDKIVENNDIVYGITTGFGALSNKFIDKHNTTILQQNLIRSHAVGTGGPIKPPVVRLMMLMRLIGLCNGNSGVRIEIANKLIEALNKNFIPMIPKKGTVGASGDLAPLSHMVLGLMGEGLALDTDTGSYVCATNVLQKLQISPITLVAKEGLALVNGTNFITSHAIFAYVNAMRIFKQSNMIAALTLEATHCTHNAFNL